MSLLAAALLSCTPSLPFYCENIYIGCAGRTRIRTEAFEIATQKIVFEEGEVWEIRSTPDRKAIIHRRSDHDDWIRIESDGRFSLRRYAPRAMMTRGMCTPKP
jgi:hypothetical protein